MMGEACYDEFDGYFPVRFNYDDTWHSNGNMSVQCHPDEDFVINNYNEFGRQDEAYYVIATGHGAGTYAGFNGDGKEFLKLAEASEKDHGDVDYQKYVNSVVSYPGRQVMIPAGTIHASGRNQFILELGSLTIGSYTYKVYDYNRTDSDGKPRPIHTKNAEKVLHFERNQECVDKNIAIEPIPYKKGEDYQEYIVKIDLPHRRAIVEMPFLGEKRRLKFGLWSSKDPAIPWLEEAEKRRLEGKRSGHSGTDTQKEVSTGQNTRQEYLHESGITEGDYVVNTTGIYGDGLLKVISVNEKNRSVTAAVPLFGELIPVQMSMDDVKKEERRKVEE